MPLPLHAAGHAAAKRQGGGGGARCGAARRGACERRRGWRSTKGPSPLHRAALRARTPLAGLAGVAVQARARARGAVARAARRALCELVRRVGVGLVKGGAVVVAEREGVGVAGGDLAQRQRGARRRRVPPHKHARVGRAARAVGVDERARAGLGRARRQAGLGLEQRVARKLPRKGAPHARVRARAHDLDHQRRVGARAQERRRPRARVEAHAQLGHRRARRRHKRRRRHAGRRAADVAKRHAHRARPCGAC